VLDWPNQECPSMQSKGKCTWIRSEGRMTLPYWISCGTALATASAEMAKPTPAEVPEGVNMAVLTPIR